MTKAKETAAEELVRLAGQIKEYQQDQGLSDRELIKRVQGLESRRTFGRILAGDLEGLDIERWLAEYRASWAWIEGANALAEDGEEIYDDFSGPIRLRRALVETMRERGIARLILLLGDTGMGKTSTVRSVYERHGQRVVVVEAGAMLGESTNAFLKVLLEALGVENVPAAQIDRYTLAVRKLCESRKCVVIEEAHDLRRCHLQLIKSLVNATPGEFVVTAMPQLWNDLTTEARQEMRQLMGNRLAERIRLELVEADVTKYVQRKLPGLNGQADAAAAMLIERAPAHGNFAFIRDAVGRCARAAEGDEITIEDVAAAIKSEAKSR